MKKYTITLTERQVSAVADVISSRIYDIEIDSENEPLDEYDKEHKQLLQTIEQTMYEALTWD